MNETSQAKYKSTWKAFTLSEWLFCLSVAAMFLPIKVYPVVFMLAATYFLWETKKVLAEKWALALAVFGVYALISFWLHYTGQTFELTNIIKLAVNFIFFYAAVVWLHHRDNSRLLQLLDYTFILIFILVALQLWVYHQAMGYRLVGGSTSSGQASVLYNKSLFFWGLDDKNMFGARIALLGFVFILLPLVLFKRVSVIRIVLIFALAFLSLSRTPIVALLIGLGLLFWMVSGKWWRLALVAIILGVTPYVLQKVIRIDNITASNDGMGVRLVYWKAFFGNFENISPLGNGFMSAPEFLSTYADFFHGEPHIHNTFLSTYLELGIIGFASYLLFLVFFFKFCYRKHPDPCYWLLTITPLVAIMMILYSGYDNDLILYLILIFGLSTVRPAALEENKIRL
jgi:O-antigen ligase